MSGTTAALQVQADTANQAAAKYMEDNELLKQVDSIEAQLRLQLKNSQNYFIKYNF